MLGKFEWEVMEYMPLDELARWIAEFSIRDKEHKKEIQRQKAQSRLRR